MLGRSVNTDLSICFVIVIALTVTLGCNKSPVASNSPTDTNKVEAGAGPDASPANVQTSSVIASKTNGATSPATKANEMPAAESTPDQVCKRFMQFLQSGNRISAENLLTRSALMTTSKAELTLEPMGGPTSTYEFTEVRFATSKKKLAQVDCSVVETVDGETFRMDMTWVVKKHTQGWRISGVMLEIEPGKVKDFLSFENHLDVQRMKMLAGSEVIEGSETENGFQASNETRQAKAKTNTIK